MTAHILVAEDELHLAEGIRENLLLEGYTVHVAADGLAALDYWHKHQVDLVVLDVMLPFRDGYAVCRTMREDMHRGHVPILFLTAKNTPENRVEGLQAGGDDYLGKPFHLKELLLRISGMLRRAEWMQTPQQEQIVWLNDFQIDFKKYQITDPNGYVEFLPQKEMTILKLLLQRSNQVVSRDDILDQVWGYDVYPSSRTVDNFIVRLRKRFELDPSHPQYFHTVRGVGYRFTPKD